MAQQYGFRASNNLSEVLDRNECLDNLGIDRRDLPLLVGTSDAGVTEADYQAIIGLSSNLEQQIVTLTGYATSQLSGITQRATITGETFTGNIFADTINNDRPYVTQSGQIIGPSTVSYFSPASGGTFTSGGQYRLGPVTAGTITTSGINYTGATRDWNSQFSRYKNFLRIQEQPSWTVRRVPLFLPPPTAIEGCATWLDAEFSEFELQNGNEVAQWKGVGNAPGAAQTTAANRPLYVTDTLNGKPAVRFDGSNDSLSMGNLAYLFPNAATLVVKARVLDSNYNIFSTLNNSTGRWNDGGNRYDLGVFTSAIINNFPGTVFPLEPTVAENNGTFVFSIRISQSFGLELRQNGQRKGFLSSGFTYNAGSVYIIGSAAGGTSGNLSGDIYSLALFNRVLTDKELQTVEEYFNWRYDGVYDPDRTQILQLEDFEPIELEDGTDLIA